MGRVTPCTSKSLHGLYQDGEAVNLLDQSMVWAFREGDRFILSSGNELRAPLQVVRGQVRLALVKSSPITEEPMVRFDGATGLPVGRFLSEVKTRGDGAFLFSQACERGSTSMGLPPHEGII